MTATMTLGDVQRRGDPALPEDRGSPRSRWDDPVWRFANTTAGKHRSTSEFDFRLVLLDETDEYEAEQLTGARFLRIPTIAAIDSDRNQPPVPIEASRGFR